jgi:menaquinone-dependent protoporphyrinogen oxidase
MMRILVTYATRAGSTREIAEFIGALLNDMGAIVAVRPTAEIHSVKDYEAVVVGSAVRMGKLLPDAVRFVRKFDADLSLKPTAHFVVCATMAEDTPEHRATAQGYEMALRELNAPISIGLFAGRVDSAKVDQPWHYMIRHSRDPLLREGDWRDWDAIRAWAQALGEKLLHPQPA